MTARTTCRSCESSDLEVFLDLGDMPPSDALVREADLEADEARYPLDVAFCRSCTLVQILETVPPEVLFDAEYPYYSSFSDALLRHSRANVTGLVEERSLDGHSLVMELASNDGYLLQYYVERGIPVLGIDPAPGPVASARERGVPTRCEFFSTELAAELARDGVRADVVHANNVLAHVADTNGFVEGLRTILKDDGVGVIEVPYVRHLIEHCEFDTIYHEHLCYFSVTALDALFRRHGLFLNHLVPLTIHGGSLRLFVGRREDVQAPVKEHLAAERQEGLAGVDYYRGFSARVEGVRRDLRALLDELKERGGRIAAYGAAAKGAVLLNYAGVGRERIDFVVDRNTHKHGRFMPGVHIPILEPGALLERMPDYALLLAWNFKDEILAQQQEYQARGGRFIVPIPHPEVL